MSESLELVFVRADLRRAQLITRDLRDDFLSDARDFSCYSCQSPEILPSGSHYSWVGFSRLYEYVDSYCVDRSFDCPPSAENSEALSLAAPAEDGQRAGTSPLGCHIRQCVRVSGGLGGVLLPPQCLHQSGFCDAVSYGGFDHVVRDPASNQPQKDCQRDVENDRSSHLQFKVVHGSSPARLSNLDCNGRLVKRGRVVSYHGLRLEVCKVNRGHCWGYPLGINGRRASDSQMLVVCEHVQVLL